MIINIVESKNADFICHAGRFHADDVFSTVLLSKIFGPEINLARVNSLPSVLRPEVIVYDIGEGQYDHHQIGGNGTRENETPYAAFGLLWKDFGELFCQRYNLDPLFTIKEFDRFVEGIDAYDNGLFHTNQGPIQNISNCIAMFNPNWEEDSTHACDYAFIRAAHFAEIVFDNVISNIRSRLHAREELNALLQETVTDTLYMPRFLPYSSCPAMKGRINFIVYPSNRGGYNLQIINREYAFRSDICGLSNEKLQQETGISSALYVHKGGYLGGVKDIRDIPILQTYIELRPTPVICNTNN